MDAIDAINQQIRGANRIIQNHCDDGDDLDLLSDRLNYFLNRLNVLPVNLTDYMDALPVNLTDYMDALSRGIDVMYNSNQHHKELTKIIPEDLAKAIDNVIDQFNAIENDYKDLDMPHNLTIPNNSGKDISNENLNKINENIDDNKENNDIMRI